jgi:hypothetical protein
MWFRVSALVVAAMLTSGADVAAQPSQLRVMAAPHARLGSFRSFHVLPTPLRADRAQRRGSYDPMAVRSRANRALWDEVQRGLVDRGYVDSEWMPDFVVAIYASIDEQLDLDAWLYGYTRAPKWWSLGSLDDSPTLFPAGTVLVDVVDPETLDVLWRGAGSATIAADPLENARAVLAVATTIVQRFPRARPVVIANARVGASRSRLHQSDLR